MAAGVSAQKTGKKMQKESLHIQLTQEEVAIFEQEMQKIGISSKSAMGRVLIRKALGLVE